MNENADSGPPPFHCENKPFQDGEHVAVWIEASGIGGLCSEQLLKSFKTVLNCAGFPCVMNQGEKEVLREFGGKAIDGT